MKSITSILAVLALGSTMAFAADEKKPGAAGDKPKRDPAEVFKKLDSNSDGKVDKKEWEASPMAKKDAAKAAETFGKKDKNSDGSLDLGEFSAGGKKKDK